MEYLVYAGYPVVEECENYQEGKEIALLLADKNVGQLYALRKRGASFANASLFTAIVGIKSRLLFTTEFVDDSKIVKNRSFDEESFWEKEETI